MNIRKYPRNTYDFFVTRKTSNSFYSHCQFQNEFTNTSDSTSSQSHHSNYTNPNNSNNYNKNSVSTNCTNYKFPYSRQKNTLPTTRKQKKKVKFNEIVDVILVKSYKKYNKDEESISIGEYFDENYNYKPKKRKKEDSKCQCNIF